MFLGILKLTLAIALFSTISSIPYTLNQTFAPNTNYIFEMDMTQDNSIIVTGSTDKNVVISKRASDGTYSVVQTITFPAAIIMASISLDGQTLAAGDTTKTEIYTYNSGTGQFDLAQTLPAATSLSSGSMTDDAQWLVRRSDVSQVQVFKYDGSSFILNQTITVSYNIRRAKLSENHLFLYILENGPTFDIYKFGGSSFASAQSFTGFGTGNKEISYTADGSVVIVGDFVTDTAYIYDYNSGTGQYSLGASIADGTNYSPLLCDIR